MSGETKRRNEKPFPFNWVRTDIELGILGLAVTIYFILEPTLNKDIALAAGFTIFFLANGLSGLILGRNRQASEKSTDGK